MSSGGGAIPLKTNNLEINNVYAVDNLGNPRPADKVLVTNANGLMTYETYNGDSSDWYLYPAGGPVDMSGFNFDNVGLYGTALSYTQNGGAVTNPIGPVAQPLDSGVYYVTTKIFLSGAGISTGDLYFDIRNQSGSIELLQTVINASMMSPAIGYATTFNNIIQVPINFSAYINYDGTLGTSPLNLGTNGTLSITLTKII